jgi:hypothetical protein
MKKFFIALTFISLFIASAFCFRDFIEGVDYIVEFQEKSYEMAAVLHVNFIGVVPKPEDVEKIVKQQLKIYSNKLLASKQVVHIGNKETRYKNIIGSAWNITNPASPIKIKFKEDLSAYVWRGRTKDIVSFPDYMTSLKNNKRIKKQQRLNK